MRFFCPVKGLVRKWSPCEIPANVTVWESCPSLGMAVAWVVYEAPKNDY